MYGEHIEALRAAAEFLAGNEWANFDTNQTNISSAAQHIRPDSVRRGIVTEQCPAASKTDGPPVEYEAGLGGAAKYFEVIGRGTPSGTGGEANVWIDGDSGQTLHLANKASLDSSAGDIEVDVVNFSEEPLQVDDEITMVFVDGRYCVFPSESSNSVPKRVKFKLDQALCKEGSLQSGFADATVIDPMNSGENMGATIVVWDYQKQFTTSQNNAIGIAIKGDPFNQGPQWHIEECEQLVREVRGKLDASLGPWMTNNPTLTEITPESTWPYVQWTADEASTQSVIPVNTRRFTAGGAPEGETAYANAKRRLPTAHLPDPDNQVAPYTLAPISPLWDYVSVDFPTARWCQTKYNQAAGIFKLDVAQYAEGSNPALHSEFANDDNTPFPPAIAAEFAPTACNVPNDTAGWAFLDDSSGKYINICTASAMFGAPTKITAVAKIDGLETDKLIKEKDPDCGVFEHEFLLNALVWGDIQGDGTGCKLENVIPLPTVDVFKNASDVEVVTGVSVNEQGELEMAMTTIKACDSPANPTTLPLQSVDVVSDVFCAGDSLQRTYSTIQFLGKNGPQQTAQISTDCIEIDYEQIVYPDYPYIDYYDIIWPDGCEPCPCTCCEQTLLDGSTNLITVADQADCLASVNANPTNPSDVVSAICVDPSECSGGSSPCDGGTISNFTMTGLDSSGGGCNAAFTQVGTATVVNGTATINVAWTGFNGFPQNAAGTITLTTDGNDWNWNGNIGWLPVVNVVGSDAGAGCASGSGGATSPGGAEFPCNGTWANGTWSFTFTP